MGQRTKWGNDAMREDGYETLGALQAYKLRLRRKRLLWQIRQAGRSLKPWQIAAHKSFRGPISPSPVCAMKACVCPIGWITTVPWACPIS